MNRLGVLLIALVLVLTMYVEAEACRPFRAAARGLGRVVRGTARVVSFPVRRIRVARGC